MLARTGLGNDTLFVHSTRKQSLSQRIVDLVRAGVQKIFPFEINLCSTCFRS